MPSPLLRDTGISVLGEMPWGAHFCLFYQTHADLLDVIVPFFAAGLAADELCVWVPSDPQLEEPVREGLRQRVPDFDRRLGAGQMEFLADDAFFRVGGRFDGLAVVRQWERLVERSHAQGFAGLRGSANLVWVQRDHWRQFAEFEDALHEHMRDWRMLGLCAYPLANSIATDVLDTGRSHQFVVARRHGVWEMLEEPALKQTKAQIARLNDELEHRVEERTQQLTVANDDLRREVAERRRVEEELRHSEAARRRARDRMLEARFEAVLDERTRLAREIHDTLLQGVTGMALQLRAILPRLQEGGGRGEAPESAADDVRRIAELSEASAREARQTIWDMRGTDSVTADLPTSLQETLRGVYAGSSFHFEVKGQPRALHPAVASTVVRIGREAVVNVVRHARAKSVMVVLEYGPRTVRLRVTDDGVGFDVENAPAANDQIGRWGLLGMRERALRIGGSVEISSAAGRGTTVELRAPSRPTRLSRTASQGSG